MLTIRPDDLETARSCCTHLHNLLFHSIDDAARIHPNEFESVLQMTGNISACFDMGVARTHPLWIDWQGDPSRDMRKEIQESKRSQQA